jgi:tetratricopeptide (TPR) repeat protein
MDKSLAFIDSANLASEDGKEPFARDKIYFLQLAKKEAELHSYFKTLVILNLEACRDDKNIKLYRFDDDFIQALSYLYQSADFHYRKKNFKKAIEILELAIETAPKNKLGGAMPNHEILKCRQLLSKIYREPAIDNYEKAIEHIVLAMDEPQSWLLDEHELLKDLDFFLQRSPNNADLQLAKAVYIFKLSWLGSRNTEEYLRENMDPLLEKAIKLGNQSHKIPLMLAIRNRVFKHHDEALIYAEEAVKLDPDNYHCQSELIEVLRNFPKTEESVFREMRKRNEALFYDQKPNFEQIIELIKNLK